MFFVANLIVLNGHFQSGNSRDVIPRFKDPTRRNRKTTAFLLFLLLLRCELGDCQPNAELIVTQTDNKMPLFDGLGSGGEKTAIVIDLGAAYTK